MVAWVYAKYLSEDPRSTVVRKSQVIAHSVKEPADFTIVGISADIKRVQEDSMKKIAIVTGASRGIGRAVAKRLAQDGFAVVVNYLSNASEAEEVVAEIKVIGGEAIAVKADIANQTDVQRLFEETMKKFGSVDVVVHNSGIMPLSPIGKSDVELFDKVISTNLRGAFLVLAQAAQRIAAGGRIIAFSSSVLAKNFPTYGPYIASKAGVEGLMHVLANELRGRNVSVNVVAPGPVATELFLKGKSEEQIAELSKMPPLERLGKPEDIASVVSFLAGPDGGWINGQVLRANGGFA
jgi:3-oxoacyl-[acyl-carrier protein] reductase